MARFVEITRSDVSGAYIQPVSEVISAVDAELIDQIDDVDVGTSITLTVVEMSQEEHDAAPEFTGW